jgi:hypothetical protein
MFFSGMTDVKGRALASVLRKLQQTLSDGRSLRPVTAAELQLTVESLSRYTRFVTTL